MCTLGLVAVGHAQMGGSMGTGMGAGIGGGMGSIPGTPYGGATDPSALQITEGYRIIPSIMVGERYDSNVFFAPKTPGLNPADYVTTTIPQVRGIYVGDLVTVNATASAIAEYYVKNPGLSYVGTNVGGGFDVSKLASQLWKGTRLTVFDTYSYTPQAPAFLTGDTTGAGTNPFVRGFQTGRVNVQSNNLVSNLSLPISQTVNLMGSYMRGFIKFGAPEGPQTGQPIDTNYTNYMAGLSKRMSPQDTLSLNFLDSAYDSGAQGAFTTLGGTVGWFRTFTPNVSLTAAAGGKVLEGNVNGNSLPSNVAPTGSFSLRWTDRETSMFLAYSLDVTPSYQFNAQPLLTHVVTISLTQQIAIPELLGVASLNYGRGDPFAPASTSTASTSLSYVSWGGTAGLTYRFTPKTFLGLSYGYTNSDQSFGGQSFRIERQLVQMSLSQAFY